MLRERNNAPETERKNSVFLNLPYDLAHQELFLGYIAGVSAFGLTPHAALEDASSTRRLDQIHSLIQECAYSIHDLSLLAPSVDPARPRLSMPFELGLAVAQDVTCRRHCWFIFVASLDRFKQSLSDLDGTDVQIHQGTLQGVFAKLMNVFTIPGLNVSVGQMLLVYEELKDSLPRILEITGAESVFEASVFKQLCIIAGIEVLASASTKLK